MTNSMGMKPRVQPPPPLQEPFSIREAIAAGITKMRLASWTYPEDHLEIHLEDGFAAATIKLWSKGAEQAGIMGPQHGLLSQFDVDKKEWEHFRR